MVLDKINRVLNESDEKIKENIIGFFMKNPKPSDKEVHAFAEELGIDWRKTIGQISIY